MIIIRRAADRFLFACRVKKMNDVSDFEELGDLRARSEGTKTFVRI